MPFQSDHLRTLLALVDEGTFEAAARRLHLTQSAVSQRVKAMEHEAGSVLVRRPVTGTLFNRLVGGPEDWRGHPRLMRVYTASTLAGAVVK